MMPPMIIGLSTAEKIAQSLAQKDPLNMNKTAIPAVISTVDAA